MFIMIQGTKGKKLAKRHPCYLAKCDKQTNEGTIFLASSIEADIRIKHRYAAVRTTRKNVVCDADPTIAEPSNGCNDKVIEDGSSLITIPPNSLAKATYQILSHPIRVQLWFTARKKSEDTCGKKLEVSSSTNPKPPLVRNPKPSLGKKPKSPSMIQKFPVPKPTQPVVEEPVAVRITHFNMQDVHSVRIIDLRPYWY